MKLNYLSDFLIIVLQRKKKKF